MSFNQLIVINFSVLKTFNVQTESGRNLIQTYRYKILYKAEKKRKKRLNKKSNENFTHEYFTIHISSFSSKNHSMDGSLDFHTRERSPFRFAERHVIGYDPFFVHVYFHVSVILIRKIKNPFWISIEFIKVCCFEERGGGGG